MSLSNIATSSTRQLINTSSELANTVSSSETVLIGVTILAGAAIIIHCINCGCSINVNFSLGDINASVNISNPYGPVNMNPA